MTESETPTEPTVPAETPTASGREPRESGPPDQVDSGVGTGIVVGATVGILAALLAVFWVGRGPATDPNATDAAAGDVRPGEATPLRPATGTDILRPDRTGGSTLILQNVGDVDAVVVLAEEATYSRAVYVRSDERVTIPNVAAGTYDVLMMLGRDWSGGRFQQAATFQELDRAIEFTEREVDGTVESTRLTVSIEPLTPGLLGVRQTEPFQLATP